MIWLIELIISWYALFEFLRLEVFSNYDMLLSLIVYVWLGVWVVWSWMEGRVPR